MTKEELATIECRRKFWANVMTRYGTCKNSLDGKHKLANKVGKNKGKLDHCVWCSRLL